jgi:hypothetical protein
MTVMNKSQAQEIAQRHLATIQQSCPVEICLNDKVIQEHTIGFVFFYDSTHYWETGDPLVALVGNGPILVRKDDGTVTTLPSYQSVDRSIKELIRQ